MSRIYNAYLEGEDRDFAIMEAESNMIFNKLFAMLEMVDMRLELNKEAAEYKVLKESGTYEDLQYLYTEAENEANQEKQGIIQTIINAIKNIISAISNGIKNFFGKHKNDNPNEMIEVDGEAWDKTSKIQSAWNKISAAFSDPKNALKIIAEGIALIGGLTFVGNKVVKKVKRSDYNNMIQSISDIHDQFSQKINSIVPDFLKETAKGFWNEVQKFENFVRSCLSKLGLPVSKKITDQQMEEEKNNQKMEEFKNNQKNSNINKNNMNNNKPQASELKADGNGAYTSKGLKRESADDELFDSDLDAFLEKYLSSEVDDSLFEEEVDERITLTGDEVENICIGGIPLKDQTVLQESVNNNDIISEEEMSELNSLFESLENEELE